MNFGEWDMFFIIDSYAWVEYLIGSKKGEKVKQLIDNKRNHFFTVECCLAELKGWSLKEKKDFDILYSVIKTNSEILCLLTEEWIEAGKIRYNKRKKIKDFGLIDAILLLKQKRYNCKILTGDKHFKDLKNIEYVGE